MGAAGSAGARTGRLLTPRTADASEFVTGLLIKPHPRDSVVQPAALPSTPGSGGAIRDQNCPNQLTFPGITQRSGTKGRLQKQSEAPARHGSDDAGARSGQRPQAGSPRGHEIQGRH